MLKGLKTKIRVIPKTHTELEFTKYLHIEPHECDHVGVVNKNI